MSIERPSHQPSPEERAKIEKERTLTEAELLAGGAEYVVGPEGEIPRLQLTDEQIEHLKELHKQEGKWVERKIVEGIDPKESEIFCENIINKLKIRFLDAVDKAEFSEEKIQKRFAGVSDSEIKKDAKIKILGRIEFASMEAEKENLNTITKLISIVSPTSWHFSKESDVLEHSAWDIPRDLLFKEIAPFLFNALPQEIKERLKNSELKNVASLGEHWALLYAKDKQRHIITNSNIYEIPGAFGYTYLDINPVNGKPIARSRYENEDVRGIFDGEKMMSIGNEDAEKFGIKEFSSCAPVPAFNSGGYRVRVQSSSNAESIINGYLYPSFTEEIDLAIKEGIFSRTIGADISPSQLKENESMVFGQVVIQPDMTLKIGEKQVKPLGRFYNEGELTKDDAGFYIVPKAKFEKF